MLTRVNGEPRRVILILDSFELARALDSWLRLEFFPALDDAIRVVLAGREPPNSAWLLSPEWQGYFQSMELGLLTLDESVAYLQECGLNRESAVGIGRAVRGHPLALTMTASLCRGRDTGAVLDIASRSVAALAERYLEQAATRSSREILEAASVIRRSTSPLLQAPFIRQVFFPTGYPEVSVEPASTVDEAAVRRIIDIHEGPRSREALLAWWEVRPEAFTVTKGRDWGVSRFISASRRPKSTLFWRTATQWRRAGWSRRGCARGSVAACWSGRSLIWRAGTERP